MSKYRVKAGMHVVEGKTVRAGETFELKSENFAELAGNGCYFEKVAEERVKGKTKAELKAEAEAKAKEEADAAALKAKADADAAAANKPDQK